MNNEKQIDIISEIQKKCDLRKVKFWLFGGWGIDALLNTITRQHDDIDLILNLHNRNNIIEIFSELNFQVYTSSENKLFCSFNNLSVDIMFFQILKDGTQVFDFDKSLDVVFPSPPITDDFNGKLNNCLYRAVSWEIQYAARYRFKDFTGQMPREKDMKELEIIKNHLTEKQINFVEKNTIPIHRSKIFNLIKENGNILKC
jgi:hypothetical protein